MGNIVYYSSTSENTHRFVEKLGMQSVRLPVDAGTAMTGPRGHATSAAWPRGLGRATRWR